MLIQLEDLVGIDPELPCQDSVCLDEIASQNSIFDTKELRTYSDFINVPRVEDIRAGLPSW